MEYLAFYRATWHGGMWDPIRHRFAMVSVPVASQLPHAVGYAMGARLDGRPECALVYFGDGATSQGDFHEACNFAGVFRAPVVFLCQNNQWAISVPLAKQTAAPIHRKAEAYGFPGVRVDGNDVLAVHRAVGEAAERAREGGGPTLIEAVTYRMAAHSTADDASRYQPPDEIASWHDADPIERLRAWLEGRGRLVLPRGRGRGGSRAGRPDTKRRSGDGASARRGAVRLGVRGPASGPRPAARCGTARCLRSPWDGR